VVVVTRLLDRALAEASRLPDQQQDTIAALILDEVGSEELWRRAFASSDKALAELADAALCEYREGRTVPLPPNGTAAI
jgi:hypothetical protein